MAKITPELLARFDVPGPRYTSYPTADRFGDAFTPVDYARALESRRDALPARARPLSLYLHIPFCASLCYYCACNKIITQHPERAAVYLDYLAREVALHLKHLGSGQPVSQLHLGGGTPTFLSDAQLTSLMDMLKSNFHMVPGGEYSIEVDPRTVDAQRLSVLAQLGFNRLSFGVQDFDPKVQEAVHRIQPAKQVFEVVAQARNIGFESINVDLIYGLPQQTPASFERTLQQINALRPERIALYAYAHLPARFTSQRRIISADLPTAKEKISILASSMASLEEAGYVYVGMDHFALPDDALAVAKRQGRLHRNFQGYSTQPDCDLIALGVSAIGRVGPTYSQNAKTLTEYYGLIDQGQIPVVRGLALSRDDLIRRAVIMAIMCQGHLHFESINLAWLIDFKSYFTSEMTHLETMQSQGLLVLSDAGIQVTPMGWFFVRGVAMLFDSYVNADANQTRFSKII